MEILDLLALLKVKGFEVFDDQRNCFNLNIVGRRFSSSRINEFDDDLIVFWKWNDIWIQRKWKITTLPGLPYFLKPINHWGTAILVPGQYKGAYQIGKHRGKYPALIQIKPVSVYRDNTLDDILNTENRTIQEGYFGINIHKAGLISRVVGPNSAGCQVFKRTKDFDEFMDLCYRAAGNWGNRFTYTLIEG